MIKKLIKKIIMWESKEFEVTPAEVVKTNIISIIVVSIMAISIEPFFEIMVKVMELM